MKDISMEPEEQFPYGMLWGQQPTRDDIPTFWLDKAKIIPLLQYLKQHISRPFSMLYNLPAVDERDRTHRDHQPDSDFTVVYHLLSFERNSDLRLKVALAKDGFSLPTITHLWPNVHWYEREEAWDMFGITFDGHPHLEHILQSGSVLHCRIGRNAPPAV